MDVGSMSKSQAEAGGRALRDVRTGLGADPESLCPKRPGFYAGEAGGGG